MRVWLDDIRPMPADFDIHVKTADDAIRLLQTGKVTAISLDHDLGEDPTHTNNGGCVADWIEQAAYHGKIPELVATVHSDNCGATIAMRQALENTNKYWGKIRGLFWVDDDGVLRGVGPFTPTDRVVEVVYLPGTPSEDIKALVLSTLKAKKA